MYQFFHLVTRVRPDQCLRPCPSENRPSFAKGGLEPASRGLEVGRDRPTSVSSGVPGGRRALIASAGMNPTLSAVTALMPGEVDLASLRGLEIGGVEDVSLGVGDFARALTNSERRDQRRRDREFRGIVRPSPAPVLLLPTVRNCFSTSACAQVGLLISASRLPAFRAMVSAA